MGCPVDSGAVPPRGVIHAVGSLIERSHDDREV